MEAIKVLNQHKLRITKARLEVLSFLMEEQKAFSHAELETRFCKSVNRVSIYRILHVFSQHKILCKFVDAQARMLYVFSGSNNCQLADHPHFICNQCDRVIHLPQLPDSYTSFLKEHHVDQLHFLAEGVCKSCLHLKD
jgi:Fur family ferric uptake transcriptional regulator